MEPTRRSISPTIPDGEAVFPNLAPKRFTKMMAAWLVGIAAVLLLSAAPAFGATSAQQVYETPEAGPTPSPLPPLPGPPAGNQQQPPPFTPQTVAGPGPTPVVAGSNVPVPTTYPCIPADGAAGTPGSGSGAGAPGAEECAEVPGDGTAVRNSVNPGPGEAQPVPEVGSESGPAPAPVSGGGGDTLPVTGFDLLIILAAAATAAGVGITLRKAAAR
jgi:hypothetical protein